IVPGLGLHVVGKNLLGAKYSDPGARSGDGSTYAPSIPQPERSVWVTLSYEESL
ncbi:MAG: hypothetical protein HY698_21245, partial [Deltaproteobacteria bacterium]|nr:hypothetical protein [Deltaproteobacteria bacterium]